jgi:uncharacterized damage-inducible protein DinB
MKQEHIIAELAAARREILDAAAALPEVEHGTAFLGVWTVKDLLAHLVGWDYANLEGIAAVLAGRLPAFYAHYDADWRTFNAGLVCTYRRASLAESLAAAEESHQTLLAAAQAVPAADFVADHGVRSPGGRRVTLPMLLSAETTDEQKHAKQLRAFTQTLAGLRSE